MVVYPSSDEVFGLVASQALPGRHAPVIVGSDSGCAEVVGNCGIAVKPGDTVALAAAMATALRGPATSAGVDSLVASASRNSSTFTAPTRDAGCRVRRSAQVWRRAPTANRTR